MALTPTNNAALLQEVDEAVRKEELKAFMSRYGALVVVAVLAILLAFGGYLYWNHRQTEAAGVQAEKLTQAMDQIAAGQSAEALKALQSLSADGSTGYRAAALIEQSNLAAQEGKLADAAKLLSQIAGDSKMDQSLRDMALIRQTVLEFDSLKPEAVIARMQPVMAQNDPQSSWFASAAELTAVAQYHLGQLDKAGATFAQIAKLPKAAPSLMSRATQMAGMLGVDAVQDGAAQDLQAANDAVQSADKSKDSE